MPYGERWRTGANKASEITVTRDVTVAGQKLAAGTYSVFMTPAAGAWKIHFNSRLGLDGLGIFANDTFTPVDLVPTDVLASRSDRTGGGPGVDQMTFEFIKTSAGADMVFRWIHTEDARADRSREVNEAADARLIGASVIRRRRTCSTARRVAMR